MEPGSKQRPSGGLAEDGAPLEWNVGDVILGLYEVTGILGEGGMGRVCRVRHREWNVDLAVKTPRPEIAARPGGMESFEREAEVWVGLGLHPNIVCCHYVRRLGGIPRVFAECVEGGSLQEWIRSGRLYEGGPEQALRRILDLAIQFAWGLHYAHEQRLVHQDVKPANVMVTPDGVAKVTDFGLVGGGGMTPAYCSPEQAAGAALTPATDLWSWALSILETFAGEITWASGLAAPGALESYLKTGPQVPGPPPLPAEVAQLLRRCFEIQLDGRPGSALECADTLQTVYRQAAGRDYPRSRPVPARALADSRNNRAVSLLDLGRRQEAEALWESALAADPHHLETIYNRGLHLWRAGRMSDAAVVQQLTAARASHPGGTQAAYLLGLVHMERGDPDAACAVLGETGESASSDVRRLSERASAAAGAGATRELRAPSHRPSVAWMDAGGRHVVSAGWDGDLQTWDPSGPPLRALTGHRGRVNALAATPDGRLYLTGGDDAVVRIWDLASARCTLTLATGVPVHAVALTPDGRLAISGGQEGRILVWDAHTGAQKALLRGHRFHVLALATCVNGRVLLSGGRDRILRVWNLETGTLYREMAGHEGDLSCIAATPDGRKAVTGSHDSALRVWDAAAGKCIRVMAGHTDWVRAVALTPDGTMAVSGGSDGSVRIWDLAAGVCMRSLDGSGRDISSVAVADSASHVLACESGACLRIWRLRAARERAFFLLCVPRNAVEEGERQAKVARLREDATQALEAGDPAGAARAIVEARSIGGYERDPALLRLQGDAAQGGRIRALRGIWPVHEIAAGRGAALCLAPLPGSSRFLTGHAEGALCLWDAWDASCLQVLDAHSPPVRAVGVSGDGRLALASPEFPDRRLQVWDLAAGRLRVVQAKWGGATSVSLSYDGRIAATNAGSSRPKGMNSREQEGFFCVLDIESGEGLADLVAGVSNPRAVALSSDEQWIAAAVWGTDVNLYEAGRSHRSAALDGHCAAVSCLAFTPEGRRILTGSYDRTLRLWDLQSRTCLRVFEGHTGRILSLAVSPDGRWAASGSQDGTLRLWDLSAGTAVQILDGVSAGALAFTTDARFLLSLAAEGTIGVWQLDWDLEFPGPDEDAQDLQHHLRLFVRRRTPLQVQRWSGWKRDGSPAWGEDDLRELLADLRTRGLGWVPADRVRRELERIAANGG